MNPLPNKYLLLCLLVSLPGLSVFGQKPDRDIIIESVIEAPVPDVWKAWTTEQGLESFMAPDCTIRLEVGGQLDVFFSPEATAGQRGVEGMHILSVEKNRLFSFTWENPADIPRIGKQMTHVTLKFYPAGPKAQQTKLVLVHDGWGDGHFWDRAYQYFVRAWGNDILFRLHYRFDKGPVNWDNPPKNLGKYNIFIH